MSERKPWIGDRLPKGLLDEGDIEPYCIDEYITFETIGGYQVLDLDFSPEDGGGFINQFGRFAERKRGEGIVFGSSTQSGVVLIVGE